jgi:acyl-CoA thioesterase FadM
MLLFFRFLLVVLSGRLRSRIGPLDESRVRFTVLPHDCDLNLHLNAGRFVSFMDVARMDLLARMRILLPLLRRGWRPVMGGCTVRYRRSMLPFERFDIRSRILGWDEKWFYIEHLVERDGALCALGTMRTLIRRKEGNVAPGEVLSLLKRGEISSPALPEFVERWRAAEDAR